MPESIDINPQHIMKGVYSYPYPEVRQLMRQELFDPDFVINTLDVEEAELMLAAFRFSQSLDLPTTSDGSLNLDELHIPVIDRIRKIQQVHMPGLDSYGNAYPMPGSSQSMFNLMAEWQAKGEMNKLAVLTGEYDGYSVYASSLGLPVEVNVNFTDSEPEEGKIWFVSNPNARDGNWLQDEQWQEFFNSGHQIVFDAAYVGLTGLSHQVDVSSPNIRAVLTSPSKLFGVFRYRNTGTTYTREPVASMYGSKWFKDIPALLSSLSLYEKFGQNELPKKYKRVQDFICSALSAVVDTEVVPSDVLLLAHAESGVKPEYEGFRRQNIYRFGLTKLFEDYERQNLESVETAS